MLHYFLLACSPRIVNNAFGGVSWHVSLCQCKNKKTIWSSEEIRWNWNNFQWLFNNKLQTEERVIIFVQTFRPHKWRHKAQTGSGSTSSESFSILTKPRMCFINIIFFCKWSLWVPLLLLLLFGPCQWMATNVERDEWTVRFDWNHLCSSSLNEWMGLSARM